MIAENAELARPLIYTARCPVGSQPETLLTIASPRHRGFRDGTGCPPYHAQLGMMPA